MCTFFCQGRYIHTSKYTRESSIHFAPGPELPTQPLLEGTTALTPIRKPRILWRITLFITATLKVLLSDPAANPDRSGAPAILRALSRVDVSVSVPCHSTRRKETPSIEAIIDTPPSPARARSDPYLRLPSVLLMTDKGVFRGALFPCRNCTTVVREGAVARPDGPHAWSHDPGNAH